MLKYIISLVVIINLLISYYLFSSPQKSETDIYEFSGIILDILYDENKMIINHDEVPGFMDRMQMTFDIDLDENLNNFSIGDSILFDFHVPIVIDQQIRPWAQKLIVVGHRPLEPHEKPYDFFDNEELLDEGDKLSDATFLNINNKEVSLSDWNGKFIFLSFIFSRCPMPNMCPEVIMKNQNLSYEFRENKNVEFLLISFDYEYDTPKILKEQYGSIFDDSNNIHFLSSYNHKSEILKITSEIGLGFAGIDEGNSDMIGHTLVSVLLDPEGHLVSKYHGDSWVPKEIKEKLYNRLSIYSLD